MQVLLGIEHTVFKLDGLQNEYKQLINFSKSNFTTKYIKENILFIPLLSADSQKRKLLLKWLYSYYKKNALNFKEDLKFELIKRIDKPIHIYFLPQANKAISFSLTFYDNAICQLICDTKHDKCHQLLLEYFTDSIYLRSEAFKLYEITAKSKEEKTKLREFVNKDTLNDLEIKFQYNKKAFELFLNTSDDVKQKSELEKAFKLLKANKTDSLVKIKKTYKKLAKAYHPDLSKLDNEESTKKFQIISDAFSLIKKYKLAA